MKMREGVKEKSRRLLSRTELRILASPSRFWDFFVDLRTTTNNENGASGHRTRLKREAIPVDILNSQK